MKLSPIRLTLTLPEAFVSLSRRLLTAAALLMVATACSSNTLEISSNTKWSGTITEDDGAPRSISGEGSTSMDMKTDNFCWQLQKTTSVGFLEAHALIKGFMRSDEGGRSETHLEFGVVSGCSGS